ncbi:Fc.00g018270.m01.CDS01 [Cosmosporella sp. VM-42]
MRDEKDEDKELGKEPDKKENKIGDNEKSKTADNKYWPVTPDRDCGRKNTQVTPLPPEERLAVVSSSDQTNPKNPDDHLEAVNVVKYAYDFAGRQQGRSKKEYLYTVLEDKGDEGEEEMNEQDRTRQQLNGVQ